MKNIVRILVLFVFSFVTTYAQIEIEKSTTGLNIAKTQKNKAYKTPKPFLRQQWYLKRRRNTDGSIPNIDKINYTAYKKLQKQYSENDKSPHGDWNFLGPNTTTPTGNQGRINSIDIHPAQNDNIYVCTPNGGIWHTITGGFSWTPITDQLGIQSFADLEIDQINPDIIYAVSGDGEPLTDPTQNHAQAEVWSAGIFKSDDAGTTWYLTEYEFPEDIVPYKLAMHPTNSNIQYLATKSGLYRTTDGWQSDVQKKIYGHIYDIEFHPTDPSIIYVSGDNKMYRSTTAGVFWPIISDADFAFQTNALRIELAVTPDAPDHVSALACTVAGDDILLYSSENKGQNDTWVLKDDQTDLVGTYAGYCIGLQIDPSDATKFYGGGIHAFKSSTSGTSGSWSQIGDGIVHADIHDIVIRGNSLYIASDGGIFRSLDQGNTWTDLSNGLHITEIYRMAGSETDNELFLIGTQDNGIQRRQIGTTFKRVLHGDGSYSLIDYNDSDIMYTSRQEMTHIERSLDAGESWNAVLVPGGNGAWLTPVIMDPIVSSTLFVGKGSVFRSTDSGITWESIGAPQPGSKLNNLAQGTSNRDRMYASVSDMIYRSDNALANPGSSVTWELKNNGLPSLYITDIAVDPTNSLRVFITLGGYNNGSKVFETTNGGDDWQNISGSLPNVPALSIAFHEDGSNLDRLYIGTDIGLFYRDDNFGDWVYFSNYLPAVPVEDLFINTNNNTIVAATYGRGLWRSDLISACEDNKYFSAGTTHTGHFQFSYNSTIFSLAKLSPQAGTNITYKAGILIDLKPGFLAPATTLFKAQIGDCPY